jgi:Uma2 family endonuclease
MNKGTNVHAPPGDSRSWFLDGGTPTWEVAYLFPAQGTWTEDDFFRLDDFHNGFPLLELSGGRLDVLPWPTETHQLIMLYLFELLKAFTTAHAPGLVLVSGMKVRLGRGRVREPDVLYLKDEHAHRRHEKYWKGADLVMEVVSDDPKDRERDLETKPGEYARAGIPEYWIIDPPERRVHVLTLAGKGYQVHGEFGPGSQANSVLLSGFTAEVDAVLTPPGSRQAK